MKIEFEISTKPTNSAYRSINGIVFFFGEDKDWTAKLWTSPFSVTLVLPYFSMLINGRAFSYIPHQLNRLRRRISGVR